MSRDKRLSMNTLLKNARIFDEDSSDASQDAPVTKIQIKSEIFNEEANMPLSFKIKTEKSDEDIKFPTGNMFANVEIKQEILENYRSPIKMEFDENTNSSVGSSSRKSARKTVFTKESPYQKESPYKFETLFTRRKQVARVVNMENNVNIKKEVKLEIPFTQNLNIDDSNNSNDLVIRRSSRTTSSPYKRASQTNISNDEDLRAQLNLTKKSRLDQDASKKNYRWPNSKFQTKMETDPEVLRRRQKQIDYGRNTLGYDVYVKKIPKSSRKKTDPQTPDKYSKYSRRGWDGLIKQWRLRLHEYDSPEDQ